MNNQKFQIVLILLLIILGISASQLAEFNIVKTKLTNLSDFKFINEKNEITGFDEAEMESPDTEEVTASSTEETSNKVSEKTANNKSNNSDKISYKQNLNIKGEEVLVNWPTEFTGKTKKEIYNIRKKFIKESIFAREYYEPSEEVFGQIADKKPWIGADVCIMPNSNLQTTKGPSEESRFINNPTLLVAIEFPFRFPRPKDDSWCTKRETILLPQKIYYSAKAKEITVVYGWLPFTTNGNSAFYMFNGVNARDLGYKYAYVDLSKSTYKPAFTASSNLGNSVHEFQDFIHLGSSCGVAGGCNNGSPRMTFAEFRDDFTKYTKRYQEIYIKLWKERPSSPQDNADITERIILNWS